MTRISLILVSLFVSYVGTVKAQPRHDAPHSQTYIDVVGFAEREVVPNEIFIFINLVERESGKDRVSIELQETELKTSFQRNKFVLDNLFLADAFANYVRVSWGQKDVVTSKSYILKVSDANEVGKAFALLDSLKITGAYISGVNHSEITMLEKEVRIEAMQAAKEKASYLLEAIDQNLGRAIRVSEAADGEFEPFAVDAPSRGLRGIYHASNEQVLYKRTSVNSIQFEKNKLNAQIMVRFEIE